MATINEQDLKKILCGLANKKIITADKIDEVLQKQKTSRETIRTKDSKISVYYDVLDTNNIELTLNVMSRELDLDTEINYQFQKNNALTGKKYNVRHLRTHSFNDLSMQR